MVYLYEVNKPAPRFAAMTNASCSRAERIAGVCADIEHCDTCCSDDPRRQHFWVDGPLRVHGPMQVLACLESCFRSAVGCNAYLTPPGSQGFAPHSDDIDAFVLQMEGSKR